MMITKRSILTISALGILTAGMIATASRFKPEEKLIYAEKAIASIYVDTVNEDKLVEDAIRGMLEKLDPHSSYSTPDETRELNEPLQGNFSGIGISFNMNRDTVYVIQTVAGGPSEKVGILAGDRIISVNDTVIAGKKMKNRDIMKKLRGPKGTKANLKVLRRDYMGADTIDFVVTRDEIPIESVDAAYMIDGNTGYIRLNKFADATADDTYEAVEKLKKQGMTQLILDLTDNGGGLLQGATDLLGEFLPPDSRVVYTEGMNSPRRDFYASPKKRNPLFDEGRMVVMMNQYSASASEITAGALQDWDRALVVGRRSFGKGLVQRPVPFPDGSMMRVTVAHYYTPTGRDIQKPYVKGDAEGYASDIKNRLEHGELMHADSIVLADSLRVETLVNRRPVYGGGGIYPDRFVPLDTTEFTKYYRNMVAKGLLNRYVIDYVEKHRKELQKEYGKSDARFVADFEVTPEMLNDLKELGEKEGVEYSEEEMNASAPLFKMIIKALIGRDIFENQTYFKVYNSHDPIFREAYRLITSPDYDTLITIPPK